MKKIMSGIATLSLFVTGSAAPVVDSVTLSQDADRGVRVGYSLSGGPAIVTVDFCTNGVSIGARHCVNLYGDVNKKVEDGTRSIRWVATEAWPNHVVTNESFTAVVKAWTVDAPPEYMAVDIKAADAVRYYVAAEAVPGGVGDAVYKTEKILMRRIPVAGIEWRMGAPGSEPGMDPTRETMHFVTLSRDYWMGVYPITQRQYKLITGTDPTKFADFEDSWYHPVVNIKWTDIRGNSWGTSWPNDDVAISHKLDDNSALARLRATSGVDFDLPTEAQWECACRAGTGTAYNNGTDSALSNMTAVGWCSSNSDNKTHAVGQKTPNRWGLYDMHGNAYEFCLDKWDAAYSTTEPKIDPPGPTSGSARSARGGSWGRPCEKCRSGWRDAWGQADCYDTVGFRVMAPIDLKW